MPLTISHWHRGAAVFLSALLASSVYAAETGAGGGLVGWVESTRGVPVAGAVISVFGKGIRGGSFITFSDSTGQFLLPSLPAGSYTLRALGDGHLPAPARHVTVLPNRDSVFTVSLTPLGESPGTKAGDEDSVAEAETVARELRWLMRHKRRSVLETHGDDRPREQGGVAPAPPYLLERAAAWVPDLSGSVEVRTTPAAVGLNGDGLNANATPASLGALRLKGRLADIGSWSLGGLLTESESTSWRMAAEFVIEPGGGHEITTGAGYGTRYWRPLVPSGDGHLDNRAVGAIFLRDEWAVGERLRASVGMKYSYVGFVQDRNSMDPVATLEFRGGRHTRIRGTYASRTLVPGGDLLTLSTLNSSPLVSFAAMAPDLRAERLSHYELAADHSLGATSLGAYTFYEDVRDPLVSAFGEPGPVRSLQIANSRAASVRGMGFTVGHRFGDVVNTSVSYTYGRSGREDGPLPELPSAAAGWIPATYREADFHDLVARLETCFDLTDTRVVAFYRVNTLSAEGDGRGGRTGSTNTRFDIQLTQGLPFLQPLTRADWEVLLAVRNLLYETTEGGTLDELMVVRPPKRVLGGISIRF